MAQKNKEVEVKEAVLRYAEALLEDFLLDLSAVERQLFLVASWELWRHYLEQFHERLYEWGVDLENQGDPPFDMRRYIINKLLEG